MTGLDTDKTRDRLRGVFVCTTFPTPASPNQGLVNAIQMHALSKHMDLCVFSPHPFFPLLTCNQGVSSTPTRAYAGVAVTDSRAFYLPLVRGAVNGWLYGKSIEHPLTKLCQEFRPHFLLTSFAFPDNVGVARVAEHLRLPLVSILRGTDIHAYCNMRTRWRSIVKALQYASVVITRSHSLGEKVIQAGVPKERVHVVYNGVDHEVFRIRARHQAAQDLGLSLNRRRILFVGNLQPVKSTSTLIEAFGLMVERGDTQTDLCLIGEGKERPSLERLICRKKLEQRVHLLGEKAHTEIAQWMSACDVVCLPSKNEGVPNVILEAFACGVPIVATQVGGIPEVTTNDTGILIQQHNPHTLTEALTQALVHTWDPSVIRQHAEKFDWDENAKKIFGILQSALSPNS